MSSTEGPNTASTRSTRSIGPQNTWSISIICSYRISKYSEYEQYPEAHILRVHEVTSSIPKPTYCEYTKYRKYFISNTPHVTPRYSENLWHIPSRMHHLQPNNTRNMSVVHIYIHPKKEGYKGKKQKGKEKVKKNTKPKLTYAQGAGPSPEGTRLLFAGTISPKKCPVDGPTDGMEVRNRSTQIRRGTSASEAVAGVKRSRETSFMEAGDLPICPRSLEVDMQRTHRTAVETRPSRGQGRSLGMIRTRSNPRQGK